MKLEVKSIKRQYPYNRWKKFIVKGSVDVSGGDNFVAIKEFEEPRTVLQVVDEMQLDFHL